MIKILFLESETAAYNGEFAKSRELTRRAADSAERTNENETAAEYLGHSAVREALVGNMDAAKQDAKTSILRSDSRQGNAYSAIALALAGDSAQAARLSDDLRKNFPADTIVQYDDLPMIRAATALDSGDASRAVEALKEAEPYELGQTNYSFTFALYPVYLRGRAYLAAKQGTAAEVEFQKILDHYGVVGNQPIGALAHLGLARSYTLQGDIPKARAAYSTFLSLWKNADPDVPLLKAAKAEFAKLGVVVCVLVLHISICVCDPITGKPEVIPLRRESASTSVFSTRRTSWNGQGSVYTPKFLSDLKVRPCCGLRVWYRSCSEHGGAASESQSKFFMCLSRRTIGGVPCREDLWFYVSMMNGMALKVARCCWKKLGAGSWSLPAA
jgi:tetratricopeptide (TPR) repeat protein